MLIKAFSVIKQIVKATGPLAPTQYSNFTPQSTRTAPHAYHTRAMVRSVLQVLCETFTYVNVYVYELASLVIKFRNFDFSHYLANFLIQNKSFLITK